jgi:hypothetical protein
MPETFETFYKRIINGKKGNVFTRLDWLESQIRKMGAKDVTNFITQIIQNNQQIIMPSVPGGTANPTDAAFTGVIISPQGVLLPSDGIVYTFAVVVNGVAVWGAGDSGGVPVVPIGGANTNVQYNDGGGLAGDANFTWDKTARQLYINGRIDGLADEGLNICGGNAVIANEAGGAVALLGGVGDGSGKGGTAQVFGGNADLTGIGGGVDIYAGAGGATSGAGGAIEIFAGDATTDGNGGNITLHPGMYAGAGHEVGSIIIEGDVKFVGSGTGLQYGSMYCDDATINTTITNANTAYVVASGMTGGLENGCTFQNSKEIQILTAGVYEVIWSMSISVNASDQTIEGLVMAGASGATQQDQTANSTRAKENGVVYSVGGSGFVTCAVYDLIRFGLENETSAGTVVTVNTATMTVKQIGA